MQADLDQDPNVLWIMIRETHLAAIHGVGLGAFEIVQTKSKFGIATFDRGQEYLSIGEVKREFDSQYEVLLGAGVPVTAQPELAMLFLDKLDPQRYAGMLAHAFLCIMFARHHQRCDSWQSTATDLTRSLVDRIRMEVSEH